MTKKKTTVPPTTAAATKASSRGQTDGHTSPRVAAVNTTVGDVDDLESTTRDLPDGTRTVGTTSLTDGETGRQRHGAQDTAAPSSSTEQPTLQQQQAQEGQTSKKRAASTNNNEEENGSNKKVKGPGSSAKGSGANRGAGFSPAEDLIVSKAYTRCTIERSREGPKQRKGDFRVRLYKAWCAIVEEENHTVPPRTADSVFKRFQKFIKPSVINFKIIMRNIKRQNANANVNVNGPTMNRDDLKTRAMDEYRSTYKQSFKFEHCLSTLNKSPKFRDFLTKIFKETGDDGDDDSEGDGGDDGGDVGGGNDDGVNNDGGDDGDNDDPKDDQAPVAQHESQVLGHSIPLDGGDGTDEVVTEEVDCHTPPTPVSPSVQLLDQIVNAIRDRSQMTMKISKLKLKNDVLRMRFELFMAMKRYDDAMNIIHQMEEGINEYTESEEVQQEETGQVEHRTTDETEVVTAEEEGDGKLPALGGGRRP